MPPPFITSVGVDSSIAMNCVRACEAQLAQEIHSPDADTVAAKWVPVGRTDQISAAMCLRGERRLCLTDSRKWVAVGRKLQSMANYNTL
jgi:hypothetical protein